jgi:hypothetical protein
VEVHISRPVKLKTLKKLAKKCQNLQRLTLSKSCLQRLSQRSKQFLKKKDIEIALQKNKGRPLSIDLEKMLRIIELKRDYRSYSEIALITGVPKSTAHYLIKYAHRSKIRQGEQVIHLKPLTA